MKRFYSRQIQDGSAVLSDGERDHCVKVLRTVVGETVEVVDGAGSLYRGHLAEAGRREARIALEGGPQHFPKPVLPVVAAAIPRNPSRWEFFLEKAVELGVDRIVPLLAARSEKHRFRRERCEQVVLSAFKQSGRYYLPVLDDPRRFTEVVEDSSFALKERFIAHCGAGSRQPVGAVHRNGHAAVILIGPEGDFTPEEVSLALGRGYIPVTLGHGRLRVETAAIVSCALLQ